MKLGLGTTRTAIVLGMVMAAFAAGCDAKAQATKPPATPMADAFKSHWDKGANGAALEGQANAGATGAGDGAGSASLPAGEDASLDGEGIRVSDRIARACNLPREHAETTFEFESASLATVDRDLLMAVARCLDEGPLRGKRIHLTGRADVRGEDEYNMSLGEARADSVRKYLHDLGLRMERVSATSRGEIDAIGTDEDTMRHDRRVDIDLDDEP